MTTYQSPVPKQKHIVVLGAGYAGLPCALRLGRNFRNDKYAGGPPVRITLINRDPRQELICELYRTLRTGKSELFAFAKVLSRAGVQFVEGIVTKIDPVAKTLQVRGDQKQSMNYDLLVLAAGAKGLAPKIPGLDMFSEAQSDQEQRVFQFRNNNQALALRMALKRNGWNAEQHLERDFFVVVLGAGITGLEVAGEIAALRGKNPRARLILLDAKDDLIGGFSGFAQKLFRRDLKRLGIEPILGSGIAKVTATEIHLANLQVIPWDLLVQCTGTQPNPAALKWFEDIATPKGIPVDPTLQIKNYPGHYAIGDVALIGGGQNHGAEAARLAQLGIQEGLFVADQIHQSLSDPENFRAAGYTPHERGLLISLGSQNGIGRIGGAVENPLLRMISPFVVGTAVDKLKKAAATKYKLGLKTGYWPLS